MTKYITRGAKPKAEEQKRGEKTEYDGKERERERKGAFKRRTETMEEKVPKVSQLSERPRGRERESVFRRSFF